MELKRKARGEGIAVPFPPQIKNMIIKIKVCIKEILEKGKMFPWKKPDFCPNCKDTIIWGHGYVINYFEGINQGVYLKRYRCPCCGTVIKFKPSGYFKQFQVPIKTIYRSIKSRIKTNSFLPGISRNRQYFWYKYLKKNTLVCLGHHFRNRLLEGFFQLIKLGIIPVSSSV